MNTSPSTITADPVIRIPAWRSVSTMNFSTRPLKTLITICQQKREASPKEIAAANGRAKGFIVSSRRVQHRVGGQQRLREDVVDRPDPQKRDHHRLVDRASDSLGAARGGQALVTADDRDHRP